MRDVITIVLVSLATYRATRFVTCDTFPPIYAVRSRVVTWHERRARRRLELGDQVEVETWLGELLTCPWCASVWVGAGIVGLTEYFTHVPLPVLTFAAAVSVTGWLGQRDDCEE